MFLINWAYTICKIRAKVSQTLVREGVTENRNKTTINTDFRVCLSELAPRFDKLCSKEQPRRLQVLIVVEEWKQKAGRFLRSLPQG